MAAERIAQALGGARRSGAGWMCICPAHDDHSPSLAVHDGVNGKLLVCCHAGCQQADVIKQLIGHDLWPTSTISGSGDGLDRDPTTAHNVRPPSRKIVTTYDYTDENGVLLYQAVRYEPKAFRLRQPRGDGWKWLMRGVRRVLYNLPAVLAAHEAGCEIYIVEGEKDADAAGSLGLVATCNAMGADDGRGNKWPPEFADVLAGADVVVIPDQDGPGMAHANWVINTLIGKARKISVAKPQVGKDLSDWIAAGANRKKIEDATVLLKQPVYAIGAGTRFDLAQKSASETEKPRPLEDEDCCLAHHEQPAAGPHQ